MMQVDPALLLFINNQVKLKIIMLLITLLTLLLRLVLLSEGETINGNMKVKILLVFAILSNRKFKIPLPQLLLLVLNYWVG